MTDFSKYLNVWEQRSILSIHRSKVAGERVRVRTPGVLEKNWEHAKWLRNGRRAKPDWIVERKHWEVPNAWFNSIVERSLQENGKVYVIQPFRKMEKCAANCRNAQYFVCECSCMGANHGMGSHESWIDVTEAFSFRWGDRELACRLMEAK